MGLLPAVQLKQFSNPTPCIFSKSFVSLSLFLGQFVHKWYSTCKQYICYVLPPVIVVMVSTLVTPSGARAGALL